MAVLTVQTVVPAGITPTYDAAAGGGDSFPNNGKTFFICKNGGGSSINVTVDATTNCDQGFDHDQVVAVANADEEWLGPFPVGRYGTSVGITYSGVTTVTVAAVSI